jgi:hypothetical protein
MSRVHHRVSSPRAAVLFAVAAAVASLGGCGGERPRAGNARPTPRATATPPPSGGRPAPRMGPARTHDDVVRAITGRRIRVAGKTVRIDAATVACGGIGPPAAHVGGRAVWRRFDCVQPTFPPGSVAGPDLRFTVVSAASRRLVVEGPHLTRY